MSIANLTFYQVEIMAQDFVLETDDSVQFKHCTIVTETDSKLMTPGGDPWESIT